MNCYSQFVDIEQSEPFITSYNPLISRNLYSYDDFTVFHPEWGIVILDTGESGELLELSRLQCDFFMMLARHEDNLYLSNWDFDDYSIDECLCIQKIDMSDPENPFKTDELLLDIPAYDNLIYAIDDYLIIELSRISQYAVINLTDFSFNSFHDYSGGITRGFGNKIIEYNPAELFKVYELDSDSLLVVASNLDLFSAHQELELTDFVELSENIVCSVGTSDIVIWDISDITDWEVIDNWIVNDGSRLNHSGNLVIKENLLYINTQETIYCIELDEYYNVVSCEETLIPYGLIENKSFGSVDTHLIVPTHDRIVHFQIVDNEVTCLGFWGGLPLFDNHQIIGDDYFLTCRSFDNYPGILKWDISNPYDPQFEEYLLPDENYLFGRIGNNFFYMHDYYNQGWDLYRYYNDEMDLMLSLPMSEYQDVFTFILTDQYDEESFYISHFITKNLKKYEIIGDELELVMDNDFPGEDCGFINNGIGYFLTNDPGQDLKIYNGFNENDPVLVNEYEDIILDGEYGIQKINDNYLSLIHISNQIVIKGYQDIELTGQSFALENAYPSAPVIYNDYLFSIQNNNLLIYHFNENTTGEIEPIQNVTFNYLLNKLMFHESSEGDFLFCFGLSAVSILEISITNGILETEIIDEQQAINAFPNPVYSHNDALVNFQMDDKALPDQGKGELSVYNIKGQRVHNRTLDFSSDDCVNWNCRLDNGKKATSGVYLLKLETERGVYSSKLIMLK